MLTEKVYVEKYDWVVDVYYHVTCYYIDDILNELKELNASDNIIEDAYNNMKDCSLNTGFTYTDNEHHHSIIVISDTSNPAQFLNTFTHELFHLVVHLSKYYNLSINGEDAAYLMGDIANALYVTAKPFLCNHNCSYR